MNSTRRSDQFPDCLLTTNIPRTSAGGLKSPRGQKWCGVMFTVPSSAGTMLNSHTGVNTGAEFPEPREHKDDGFTY